MRIAKENKHTLRIHSKPVIVTIGDYGPVAYIIARSKSNAENLHPGEVMKQFEPLFKRHVRKPSILCMRSHHFLLWLDGESLIMTESPFIHRGEDSKHNKADGQEKEDPHGDESRFAE